MADEPKTFRPPAFQDDLLNFNKRLNQLMDPTEVSGVPTEQILKEVSPNEVLILPCGSAKNPADCAVEAFERYSSPMWNEARKAMGGPKNIPKFLKDMGVDLKILSAEHGLMDAGKRIENYDRELTPERLEEIKGDEALRGTISNTLAQYDPDKIFLGTPSKYTKLITDIMGRNYKSVFPEGSGIGKQKQGIVNYLKSKSVPSKEMVPYQDLEEPTLPLGDKSKKEGGATKPKPLGWGLGSLARKYQPLFQLIQVAQGMWDDLSPETKEEFTRLMNTPLDEAIGLDTSGLDYFRDLLGILPPGGVMDVANEVPDEYQLDLVEDTDLAKDYVKDRGIGGLFDFDQGEGSMETAKEQQAVLDESSRRQSIMDKSVDPYEKRKRQSYWGEDRYTKVARNPLLEIAGVSEETQPRPVTGNIYRQEMYRQAMGDDPKFKEGQMPRGFSEADENFLRDEGLLYPSEAPKTNYFVQPRFEPLEVPEWNKGPGAQIISGEDLRYQSFELGKVAEDPAYHDKQLQEDSDFWQDILIKPAPWAVKKNPGGGYSGSAHPPHDMWTVRITENATKQSQMAKDLAAHNEKVIGSYERNIENAKYRINWINENPTKFSLDTQEVDKQIKNYTQAIKNIEKRISELKEQNEELTTGNFKEHPRINRGGSKNND